MSCFLYNQEKEKNKYSPQNPPKQNKCILMLKGNISTFDILNHQGELMRNPMGPECPFEGF